MPDESQHNANTSGFTQAQWDANAAFQNELKRRKRLLLMYIGMLVVPVAVFFTFLIWGRTDEQVVKAAAEEGVKTVVENRIVPVANNIVAVQAEIKKNEQQSRKWYSANQQQFETLQKLTTDFQQEFPIPPRELAESVTQLKDNQENLSQDLVDFKSTASAFQDQFTVPPKELVGHVTDLQEKTQALSNAIAEGDERLAAIGRSHDDLSRNLAEFQKRIYAQTENLPERLKAMESNVALIEAQRKTIESLSERLKNLEARTETIQKERKMDAEALQKMKATIIKRNSEDVPQ